MDTASKDDFRQYAENTDLKHIPGSYGLPLLGRGLNALFDFPGLVADHAQRWGDVSRVQVVDQKGVLLLGADHLQTVFLDRERNFSTEMGYQRTLKHFYNNGLLMRDFDELRVQRRILQSAFKLDAMREYVAQMNTMHRQSLDSWQGRQKLEFFPEIKELLLRIGSGIFIGISLDSPALEKEYRLLNKAFLDIADGFLGQVRKEIPGTKFRRGRNGSRYLREYIGGLLAERRAGEGGDMLSYMCRERMENGELFSDEDVISHAAFLLFGAHDTTTSVLNHLVMYCAQNPELQARLRAECQALGKDALDYEDLDKLVDVENAFNECMRLHPPIPFLNRRSIREVEFDGHRIPANTVVMCAAIHNHYSPAYWTNPEAFDLDRFSKERAEHKSHPFAYFPFGGGAHKCIGMHFGMMLAKTYMHQLLCRYEFSLPDGFKPKLLWVPLPRPAKLPLELKPLR